MAQKATIVSRISVNLFVCPSVRLFVFPSLRPSICMYNVYRQPLRHLKEDHEVIVAYSKICPFVQIFIVQKTIFKQTIFSVFFFLVCLSVHRVYLFTFSYSSIHQYRITLNKSKLKQNHRLISSEIIIVIILELLKKYSICPSISPSSPSVQIFIVQKANFSIQNIKKLYSQANYVRKQTVKLFKLLAKINFKSIKSYSICHFVCLSFCLSVYVQFYSPVLNNTIIKISIRIYIYSTAGCQESQFYSLTFGQAVASIYWPKTFLQLA